MGQLDARELVDVVAEAGLDAESADDICNLRLGFGVQCVACSDGEEYCATLEVNRLVADETGETLGLVCEGDCHESCSSNSGLVGLLKKLSSSSIIIMCAAKQAFAKRRLAS